MDNKKYDDLAEIFKALAHPLRLRIVCGLIINNECNVNKMVDHLDVPQPTISQHLNILKNAGVIDGVRKGNQVCYKVINEQVRILIEALSLK